MLGDFLLYALLLLSTNLCVSFKYNNLKVLIKRYLLRFELSIIKLLKYF